jgi:L-lactate dehydrogenase complex protein LldG
LVEQTVSAREEILSRVRAAISPKEPTKDVPRHYRTTTGDGIQSFFDRLAHYEATTHLVDAEDLGHRIRDILEDRRIVTPAGIPDEWVENAIKDDPPLAPHDLDRSDGVITTCALAIAQTGTIVLDGGPGMGRRALTLLPDYHLCIVKHDQIVSSVPEAIRQLRDPTRPLTFISGPSATVDIEMVRVRGVHGPRRLEVIVAIEPTEPIEPTQPTEPNPDSDA